MSKFWLFSAEIPFNLGNNLHFLCESLAAYVLCPVSTQRSATLNSLRIWCIHVTVDNLQEARSPHAHACLNIELLSYLLIISNKRAGLSDRKNSCLVTRRQRPDFSSYQRAGSGNLYMLLSHPKCEHLNLPINYVMAAQHRTQKTLNSYSLPISVDNTENGPFVSAFKISNQKTYRFIHTENTAYVNENLNDHFSVLFTPVKNVIQNVADIQTTKSREKKTLV
jgi:hypothetical protein